MAKKGLKWLLFFFSIFYAGFHARSFLGEPVPGYILMIVVCLTAAYCLSRELGFFKADASRAPGEPATMPSHPVILMFIEENRELLERTLNGPARVELSSGYPLDPDFIGHLLPAEKQIVHSSGVDFYRCNYRLRCGKNLDGIYIKFFSRDWLVKVPFDPENTDHKDLLDHLQWMIRGYGIPITVPEGVTVPARLN